MIHGSDLTISQVSILSTLEKENVNIPFPNPDYIQEKQYWILKHTQELPKTFVLSMNFAGNLSDSLRGFYRSKLSDNSYIATTQFEPTDARKAFPCFDEPNKKSTFNISIIAPKGYHALSNMPVLEKKDIADSKTKYIFHETKRMSTYLIAFIVSK